MPKFKCESCKKTFEADDDNEETARAELQKEFPDTPDDEIVRVCETCYQKIKKTQELMQASDNSAPIKFEFGEKVLLQGLVLRELATIGKRFEEETLSQYQIDMMSHVGNTLKVIAEKFAGGGEIAAVEEILSPSTSKQHLH